MSLEQIISYCCGGGQLKRSSSDIRREKVETAVRRLDVAIARNHEIGEALRESYREAAESSKKVLECLTAPSAAPSRLNKDEYEDLP